MKTIDAPIPGQSLTTAPKSMPFERPPQIVDPKEAIDMHLERLLDPERVEAVIDALELDVSVAMLTKGLLRSAVSEGIHTIDVSMVIAPVIHQAIKNIATSAGIEYDEGLVDKEKALKDKEDINAQKLLNRAKKYKPSPKAEKPVVEEKVEEAMPEEDGFMEMM